jgi:hypothetical protein
MRQPKRDCLDAIHRAKREFGDTDIYDIYEDVCRSDSSCAPGPAGSLRARLSNRRLTGPQGRRASWSGANV